jgi:hypothetical protein
MMCETPLTETMTFEVDSTSSDPQLCGPMDIRIEPAALSVRWTGEETWEKVEWWELLFIVGRVGGYKKQLSDLRSGAYEDGFKAGADAFDQQMRDERIRARNRERTSGVIELKTK